MTKKQLAALKRRLKNPAFLLAVAGLVYQIVQKYQPEVKLEEYQLWVDLATYIFIGGGIYSVFTPQEERKARKKHKTAAQAVESIKEKTGVS